MTVDGLVYHSVLSALTIDISNYVITHQIWAGLSIGAYSLGRGGGGGRVNHRLFG